MPILQISYIIMKTHDISPLSNVCFRLGDYIMSEFKHFTLSERIKIEQLLNQSLSFKEIGRKLDRDCTSISKEVKKHIQSKKTGAYGRAFNDCIYRYDCDHSHLCEDPNCKRRYCRFCSKCHTVCPDYQKYECPLLKYPPYVCNGCKDLRKCTLEKHFYSAASAQKGYETFLSESRSGVNVDEKEVARLNEFISPLIQNGQSLYHIYSNNMDVIMHSEKTIYNYIDRGLFSARNIDLPRKVIYRPRKSCVVHFKVDKACRLGRSYEDYLAFMEEHPDTPVVEMDTVEGTKGGKVLLTIHFTTSSFMLAYIRDANTSQSVIDIFEHLSLALGNETFTTLFPLILTDGGSEFSNPSVIEFDRDGNRRTRIFYCDPGRPQQKGALENNHELIRRIVPKGHSFDAYNQEDITLMMNHINSYGRKKLNDKPPYLAFSFFHGTDTLRKLDSEIIPANEIILKPKLLKK
jgi:transposase, IS30 family